MVAGKGDLLAGQHLDDVQQDQLGSELHTNPRCDFVDGEDLGRLIKRAAAEVAQNPTLVASVGFLAIGFLAIGLLLNLAGLCANLLGDKLDVRQTKRSSEKLTAGLEVACRHQEAGFVGGRAQALHQIGQRQCRVKKCLRSTLLNTGGDSNASCSNVLKIFILAMRQSHEGEKA